MITENSFKRLFLFLTLFSLSDGLLFAQGYDGPLTIQGLDRRTLPSVAARSMGGVTLALRNEIGLMFQNPATLTTVERRQISFGGLYQAWDRLQIQEYAPVRYYSNFSLLMEGRTDRIPNPNPLLGGSSAADTVQRPFDALGPNWSTTSNRAAPLQGLAALPFSGERRTIVIGFGTVEYAHLDHYYQNNNALQPAVFSQRPLPAFRPSDLSPVQVQWFQYIRSREGTLRGYGVALAGKLAHPDLSVGLSALLLDGSSDDYESIRSRGRLTFFSNAFRLDSLRRTMTSTGRSEYKGMEWTFGSVYSTQVLRVGFSTRLPMTLTRTYSTTLFSDTAGVITNTSVSGEDELRFPWSGSVAMSIEPRENLLIGLEYHFRPYASVVYRSASGESSPWLSSSVARIGVQYRVAPWLALRAGMRGQAEVFEPQGNPIAGEPVSTTVYSFGAGVSFNAVRVNVAYEYVRSAYEDIWGSAVSMNRETRHTVALDVAYEIPW